MKKFCVCYFNDWGNRIVIKSGSLESCESFYEKNIGMCEGVDATIQEL